MQLPPRFSAELEEAQLRLRRQLDRPIKSDYDVVIIGSGAGGGTFAYALAGLGASVLLIERGDFLPQEPRNWNTNDVLVQQSYANSEPWLDASGMPYNALHYYYVGGMTKLYAGTLLRFRQEDFGEIAHGDGVSPSWPVSYTELEPYYNAAEKLYLAHGLAGEDPTEPPRSAPFPFPPVPVVPEVQDLRVRLNRVGLRPFPMPQGLDLREDGTGRCLFCAFCDSYPCQVLAKGDTERCCIRPALASSNVSLLRRTEVRRLITDESGREVLGAEIATDGETATIRGGLFVLAAGAVNSPALLLRSANSQHKNGLGNSSGCVGRHYMRHDISVVMTETPSGEVLPNNHFWKSIGVNDYYLSGTKEWNYPLGTVQVIGNYHEFRHSLLPNSVGESDQQRQELAERMLPIFVLTEDLPRWGNRVSLERNQIMVHYRANNLRSHFQLVQVVEGKLKEAGFGLTTHKSLLRVEDGGGYHHCGTLRAGLDPGTSVVDEHCKAHDLENLFVVDASCFSSSSASNPMLTIAANSLRVADFVVRTCL